MKKVLANLFFIWFVAFSTFVFAGSFPQVSVWDTNWNEMTLWVDGNVLTGEYIYDDGVISGTLDGHVFTGWWREAGNAKACGPGGAWSGPAVFTFSDDWRSFTGDWGYCSADPGDLNPTGSGWAGTRLDAQSYTEQQCVDVGRYWCNGECGITPCGVSLDQETCENAGRVWCDGLCKVNDCNSPITESDCLYSGLYFCDGECVAEPCSGEEICDANHLGLCATEDTCTSAGGYWYVDLCHDAPESGSTPVIISTVDDSWVYGASVELAGRNYGDADYLAGYPTSNCNTANAIAYLKFNLGYAPAEVEKVNLVVEHMPHTAYCYSNCQADFYFYPVLESWDEMAITYNNRPALGETALYGPISISFPNDFGQRKYDITDIYRQWKSGSLADNGLAIYSPTVGCNNAAVSFYIYSSENTDHVGPYLEITMADTPSTGASGHNGMLSVALPLVDFPATPVNATTNEVRVGACPEVVIQPTMQVPAADVGQTAQLIMYIYLPDLGFGISIPSRAVTLLAETTCDLLPSTIDLSGSAGLSFYVYYGYVLGSSIKYNAYAVVVDSFCADDCGSITDTAVCNATPGCAYQTFPAAQCVMDCGAYGSQSSCESAFDGNTCVWSNLFKTCGLK